MVTTVGEEEIYGHGRDSFIVIRNRNDLCVSTCWEPTMGEQDQNQKLVWVQQYPLQAQHPLIDINKFKVSQFQQACNMSEKKSTCVSIIIL